MPGMRVLNGLNARCGTSPIPVGTSCGPRAATVLPARFTSQPASVPPDVGKCRSSARQTGHRCPRTILHHQTCPAPSAPTSPTRAAPSPTYRLILVRACPLTGRRADPRQHQQYYLRRPRAERALLPSRLAAHAPVQYAPRLRRVSPSRCAAVAQVKHGPRLASCRNARGRPRCGP